MKPLLALLILVLFAVPGYSQTDSCGLRISLLTCSPGQELYSTFGHSALRVQENTSGTDIIYNYGTFDFSDPYFLVKFVRGKLPYFLSIEDYHDFVAAYAWEKRGIQEQVLLLSCAEKQQLVQALQHNLLPENRNYRYDFLWDNCSTRLRDIVAKSTSQKLVFDTILPVERPTYRNMIHSYLDAGGQYWSKLGIDLLLGSRLDIKVTNQQAMFLPDYLKKGFDSAAAGQQQLVQPSQILLQQPTLIENDSLLRPIYVFSLLALIIIALSFVKTAKAKRTLQTIDLVLFFIVGLAGLLLLFMWFGTDHTVCKDNFNLLWALPTHAFVAFLLWKNKPWVRKYLWGTVILLGFLLVSWFILPQELNNSLLPIVVVLLFRSWMILKKQPAASYA